MGTGSTTTRAGASTAAPVAGPAVADTRTSTIVVAASNSLDPTLAPLLYRCTGVNDEVEMTAALVAAAAVNGRVELLEGDYNTTLTLSVAVNVALFGNGWGTVIHFNAGGAAITVAGDNVKLRDFKVVIVAGAGGAGTRPNCIFADTRTNIEITNVWLIGDKTVGYDGSLLRQNGIFLDTVTNSMIGESVVENQENNGFCLSSATGNRITGNTLQSNYAGIDLRVTSNGNTVTGNSCQGNSDYGISLDSSNNNTVVGNTCSGEYIGITLILSLDNTVTGNTCEGNSNDGIYLESSNGNTITGNTCKDNDLNGIELYFSSGNTVTGNTCNENYYGINLALADNNTITGNTCSGNDHITSSGIELDQSNDNLILGNTCNNNTTYGIKIAGASSNNVVKHNQLIGNGTGPFFDNGIDTELATKTFQFQHGGDNAGVQTANFIHTDASAKGWLVDAVDEWAIALGQMPLVCQMVVRIKIWAVNLAAAGGADVEMSLNIIANAGGSDEPYTTEAIAVVDKPSVEDNLPANDVIHWVIDATDDEDIDDIQGGDSLELKVNYNAGAAPDIATNAVFRAMEIEYV